MRKFVLTLLVCWFASTGLLRAQTLDQEMSKLADKLSNSLVPQGFKSVAAIDFTDLQGQPTELGRFLSERLAVEIVSSGGVSMVDRANIKSILAEHKLTEAGLVNPENAKKLGEFAGVDVILTGNVTALDDGIEVMVKGVATSTARIVAAGRIKFAKSSEIQQLLNRSVSGGGTSTGGSESGSSYRENNAIATKDLGSLRVVLKSVSPLKLAYKNGQSGNGIRCTFEFINRETRRPIAVAMNASATENGKRIGDSLRTTLVDDRGSVWRLAESGVAGIGTVGVGVQDPPGWSNSRGAYSPAEIATLIKRQDDTGSNTDNRILNILGRGPTPYPYQFVFGSMTEIAPGQSSSVTMNFLQDAGGPMGVFPKSFELNSEVVVSVMVTDTRKSHSLQNLTFDRVSMPAR